MTFLQKRKTSPLPSENQPPVTINQTTQSSLVVDLAFSIGMHSQVELGNEKICKTHGENAFQTMVTINQTTQSSLVVDLVFSIGMHSQVELGNEKKKARHIHEEIAFSMS